MQPWPLSDYPRVLVLLTPLVLVRLKLFEWKLFYAYLLLTRVSSFNFLSGLTTQDTDILLLPFL